MGHKPTFAFKFREPSFSHWSQCSAAFKLPDSLEKPQPSKIGNTEGRQARPGRFWAQGQSSSAGLPRPATGWAWFRQSRASKGKETNSAGGAFDSANRRSYDSISQIISCTLPSCRFTDLVKMNQEKAFFHRVGIKIMITQVRNTSLNKRRKIHVN